MELDGWIDQGARLAALLTLGDASFFDKAAMVRISTASQPRAADGTPLGEPTAGRLTRKIDPPNTETPYVLRPALLCLVVLRSLSSAPPPKKKGRLESSLAAAAAGCRSGRRRRSSAER